MKKMLLFQYLLLQLQRPTPGQQSLFGLAVRIRAGHPRARLTELPLLLFHPFLHRLLLLLFHRLQLLSLMQRCQLLRLKQWPPMQQG